MRQVVLMGPRPRTSGCSTAMTAAYCDRLYVMSAGTVVAHGTPQQVLTPARIREVFEVDVVAGVHPVTGKLQLAFY